MNKKLGRNEASHILKKNTVIMTFSFIAVALFIGTAIQPVLADSVYSRVVEPEPAEVECPLCAPKTESSSELPGCKTCVEAVNYAVEYSVVYVKEKVDETPVWYPLKVREITIHFRDGVFEGLVESGFSFKEIDKAELTSTIEYWVNLTVGEQTLNRTKFVAYLGAITIGITGYLLSLCNKENTKGRAPIITPLMMLISRLRSIISRWLMAFHMVRP